MFSTIHITYRPNAFRLFSTTMPTVIGGMAVWSFCLLCML